MGHGSKDCLPLKEIHINMIELKTGEPQQKLQSDLSDNEYESNLIELEDNSSPETIKPRNKMSISLVFKKTCYKCGNLGHHADDCIHNERLCYNCKNPGHESSNCPEGKKTDIKQCYFCKEVGHIQAECTNYVPSSQNLPSSSQISKDPSIANNINKQPTKSRKWNTEAPPYNPSYQRVIYPMDNQLYPLPPMIHYVPNTIFPYQQIPPIYLPPPQTSAYNPMNYQMPIGMQPMGSQYYALDLMNLRSKSYEDQTAYKRKLRCYTCGEIGHDSKHCKRRHHSSY